MTFEAHAEHVFVCDSVQKKTKIRTFEAAKNPNAPRRP